MSASALFRPLNVGKLVVPNRIWVAPTTRSRATIPGHVPHALNAQHYGQRATAGLIIAEATMIAKGTSAFYKEPGIYSDAQIAGWKLVTDAVHANGGRIFLQIVHCGRAAHPLNNPDGEAVVSSGDKAIKLGQVGEAHNPTGKKVDYVVPRPLTDDEAKAIVAQFGVAASNAVRAGFDGVEVHGANGYLIDQFLDDGANTRTSGPYSGKTLETRAQFLVDCLSAASKAIGADRVGLRISPHNNYNDMKKADPVGVTTHVAKKASEVGIAYLHLMRANFFGPVDKDLIAPAKAAFKGPLVTNMGYTPEEAEQAVAEGKVDAVAFGSSFIANSDLPKRIQLKAPLNAPNPATFYGGGAEGYTDYPVLP